MRFIEFDNILSIRYISKIFNMYLSPKLTQNRFLYSAFSSFFAFV